MGKIKGWKQIGNYKKNTSWRSVKHNLVSLSKSDYKGGWSLTINGEKIYYKVPREIAYQRAIKYMRSHPNG